MHSRAARSEGQKSFGTDGAAGMFLTLSAGEMLLTALWRKGVTGLDMTSEIFLLFGDVDQNNLCCFGRTCPELLPFRSFTP